jgi:hypothetical protein
MKRIGLFILPALLVNSLFADVKKPLDINEFTKEIEKIQSVTKQTDDSLELTNTINKKQNESTLVELESRNLKPEATILDINFITAKISSEIRKLEDEIRKESFISSNRGFNIGNAKYKKVAFEDIQNAYLSIVEKRKKLDNLKKTSSILKNLKSKENKNIFYNREVEQLLTEIKNDDSQQLSINDASLIQTTQTSKNYIDVKVGDKIAGAKIIEVTQFGVRIR